MSKNSLFRLCATNKLTNVAVCVVVVLEAIVVVTNIQSTFIFMLQTIRTLDSKCNAERKQVTRTSSGVEENA